MKRPPTYQSKPVQSKLGDQRRINTLDRRKWNRKSSVPSSLRHSMRMVAFRITMRPHSPPGNPGRKHATEPRKAQAYTRPDHATYPTHPRQERNHPGDSRAHSNAPSPTPIRRNVRKPIIKAELQQFSRRTVQPRPTMHGQFSPASHTERRCASLRRRFSRNTANMSAQRRTRCAFTNSQRAAVHNSNDLPPLPRRPLTRIKRQQLRRAAPQTTADNDASPSEASPRNSATSR
jgi:hypothetical protein